MSRLFYPLAFLGPSLTLLLAFRLLPVVYGFWLSLTTETAIGGSVYVGTANYQYLFHDPILPQVLRNNGLLLLFLPVWVFVPFVMAIVLHEHLPLARVFKFCYLVPTLLSPVVIGTYFSLLLEYDGPVNKALRALGLGSLARQWLIDPTTVVWVFIAIVIWASLGVGVLFFANALESSDEELYDAARVDGASWWARHRYITVPLLAPVTEFWAVVVLISSFTAIFPLLFVLTGGGPGNVSTVIDLYIYQVAFQSSRLGYASALGISTFVLILLLTIAQLHLFGRRRRRVVRLVP